MSSTELFEAASNSKIFNEFPFANEVQLSHLLHASPSAETSVQLMVLAKILAQVVLPTPRGPQNKNAWATWLVKMEFFKVEVIHWN